MAYRFMAEMMCSQSCNNNLGYLDLGSCNDHLTYEGFHCIVLLSDWKVENGFLLYLLCETCWP